MSMSGVSRMTRDCPESWHDEADVVVVGYGYAGAVAALEAQESGADVLLIEKMPDPGGISITSGGNLRTVEDSEEGFQYLRTLNAGTVPDGVLRAFAEGMKQIPDYLEKLCTVNGATINRWQQDA